MVCSLYEIAAFDGLSRVATRFGVTFTLLGSCATRAALMDLAGRLESASLFDLAPNLGDIDLVHPGPPGENPLIREAISWELPLAHWFRFSLLSATEHSVFRVQRSSNCSIPLREIEIGEKGILDPADALREVYPSAVSFKRNAEFAKSPLAANGLDREATAVPLFLDSALDASTIIGTSFSIAPGSEEQMREAVESLATLSSLEAKKRGAVQSRIWYRMMQFALRIGPVRFGELRQIAPINRLLTALPSDLAQKFDFGIDDVIVVSSALEGTTFRANASTNTRFLPAEDATQLWKSAGQSLTPRHSRPFELGSGQRLVGAIQGVQIVSGEAASSEQVVAAGVLRPRHSSPQHFYVGEEFIHVAFRQPAEIQDIALEDLSAFIVGRERDSDEVHLIGCFATVDRSHGPNSRLLTLRLGLGSTEVSELREMDVFLVAWEESNGYTPSKFG